MTGTTFKTFADRISELPDQAVIGALDRECEMLRRNLAKARGDLSDQAYSIFYYKLFVRAAKLGDLLDLTIQLPADEVEFFQKTTARLVQAEALPASALGHFQSTFRVTEKGRNLHLRKNRAESHAINGFELKARI